MSKRVANYVISEKLDTLCQEITSFKKQYELDMRGDKKINGDRGIVGEIRSLKDNRDNYPSLTWLLNHKPKQTIGAIALGFAILQFLMTTGAVWLIEQLW